MKHGAGILFYDSQQDKILAAKKNKQQPRWEGIGGSSFPSEVSRGNFWETAFRETMEELFGLKQREIKRLQQFLEVKLNQTTLHVFASKDYTFHCFVLSFRDLEETILPAVVSHGYKSPYYRKIPQAISGIIRSRRRAPDQEIEILHLLEVGTICLNNSSPELLMDVGSLAKYKISLEKL